MMNRNDKEFIVQKIRTQYMEKQPSDIDALKALDKKVVTPANAFAYIFGSIGAIVMGMGMSLVMTDIGEVLGMASTMLPGIVTGVVGMAIAIVNYPIYKAIVTKRRKKYAPEIIALSEKIMND